MKPRLHTLKSDPQLATNSDGELLDEVMLGYVATPDRVSITTSSLVETMDAELKASPTYNYWVPRRELLTISAASREEFAIRAWLPPGTDTFDDIWFSRHLRHEILIWKIPTELERLIRAAISEGLHIVSAVDSMPEPTTPYPREAFDHQGFQYRRGDGRYFSGRRFPFLMR